MYPQFEPAVQPPNPRSLTLAVVGPANAGKSTWTNRICGLRVTPVSSKPQTTRERMCGIATIENTQLVIYDTPGLLSDLDRKKYVNLCCCNDGTILFVVLTQDIILGEGKSFSLLQDFFLII